MVWVYEKSGTFNLEKSCFVLFHHLSRVKTVATNNASELNMNGSYSHLTSTFHWQVQDVENKLIYMPAPLNKCDSQKQSFKEIEESKCLEESNQQPAPVKTNNSEDLDSQLAFVPSEVPLWVPSLLPTGPTYTNEFTKSKFIPCVSHTNTLSNLHRSEYKPYIPKYVNVSDLQINTDQYIQHLQNVFVQAYQCPSSFSESIPIDSLLDDSFTEDIDLSKEKYHPTENTNFLTNPFIDSTAANKVESHSIENLITHFIKDNICKEKSVTMNTTSLLSDQVADVFDVSKEKPLSDEATIHLPNPISEDMIIIKDKSFTDSVSVITNFDSAINHIVTARPDTSNKCSKASSWKVKVQCELCHKMLKNKYRLKIHMEAHNGKYPHVCVICNKGFERSSRLGEHRKRQHPILIL